MTKSSKPAPSTASRWLLPASGVIVVAVALIAFVLSQSPGADVGTGPSGSPSVAPSATAGPSTAAPSVEPSAATSAAASAAADLEPIIIGTPLPKFDGSVPDPAAGLAAPVVNGFDHSGQPVAIAPTGRVTMVIFAAHWCPHCQREIPLLQAWVDAGGLSPDVDIVTVSTAIDPTLPNYPPEDWFAREHWTAPVMVDPTNTVAAAYGLPGYPYFVILDGAGDVYARLTGEIPVDQLASVLANVPRS